MATKKKQLIIDVPLFFIFVCICLVVFVIDTFFLKGIIPFLASGGTPAASHAFNPQNPLDYIRLFTHIFAHKTVDTLALHSIILLLTGQIMLERYGSFLCFIMIFSLALITGILNAAFVPAPLYGAQGLVFAILFILSFAQPKKYGVLLSYTSAFSIFFIKEVYAILQNNTPLAFIPFTGSLIISLFAFFAKPTPRQRRQTIQKQTIIQN